MSDAYSQLASTAPASRFDVLTHAKTLCDTEEKSLGPIKPEPVCQALETSLDGGLYVLGKCADTPTTDGCGIVWRGAIADVEEQAWTRGITGWANAISSYLTGVAGAGAVSLLIPYLMLVGGVAGLVVALGLGTKGRVAGVWIDTRNRVSLARAQVTLWSIVVLGGYACMALFNVGLAGVLKGLATFNAYPSIPGNIAAALGIAATSPLLSHLILDTKDGVSVAGDATPDKRGLPFLGNAAPGLATHETPAEASMADLFMGEEIAVQDTVDVSRLQNVVITLTLVISYAAYLTIYLRAIDPTAVLDALHRKVAYFPSLPEAGFSFAALLFASHATYLVAKSYDKAPDAPTSNAPTSNK